MKVKDLTLKQIKEICKKHCAPYCPACPIKAFCLKYVTNMNMRDENFPLEWNPEDMEREVKK